LFQSSFYAGSSHQFVHCPDCNTEISEISLHRNCIYHCRVEPVSPNINITLQAHVCHAALQTARVSAPRAREEDVSSGHVAGTRF